MNTFNIMAIRLDNRNGKAPMLQEILTRHGCIIKMRLGLHEADSDCSDQGLILLKLSGSKKERKDLEDDLGDIGDIKIKMIEI